MAGELATATAVERAKAEIAFAYENVRFFRAHMDAAGVTPRDIVTADDIRRVPLTRKADYRKNFPIGVLAQGRTLKDPFVYRSESAGTGGERVVTVTHTYALAQRMMGTVSVHPGFYEFLMGQAGRRTIRYAAPNCSDVECANPHSTMADRMLHEGTLVLPVHYDLLATTPAMVDQAIAEWIEYEPQFLYVDPTHLAFLIRNMRKRGVTPPDCEAVALTYTQCTSVARRQVDEFFPPETPIADVISMSELGWIVMECPRGRHHINNDCFYTEFLVGDRPAEPGELAELVVTSLGDRLMPHVRYRTGDYYRWISRDCECGHRFPAVHHEGRRRDFLVRLGKIRMTPRTVNDVVGPAEWIDVFTMRQRSEDEFQFRFAPNEKFEPRLADDLAGRFRAELGTGARVEMDPQNYLSSDRSGKFFSCLSDLSEEVGAPA